MTQKRGLGRGLGALIPGAGQSSSPSRRAAQEPDADAAGAVAAAAESPSDGEAVQSAADAYDPPLRTRQRHPRTTPEPGESGSSSRPVDMFFSGDPVGEAQRPARSASRDLAEGMARAAAERRAGVKKAAPAKKSTPARKSASADEKAAPTAKKSAPAAEKPATAAKKSAEKPAPAKRTPAAKKTARKDAAPTTRTTAKTATTKKAAAGEETPAKGVVESPVEVETVVPTPPAYETAASEAQGAADRAETESTEQPVAADPSGEQTDETPASGAGEGLVAVPGAEFAEIPIHEIRENPRNPRTQFDEDALDELAYSLREVGVLQPVVVRPIPATDEGESFELVMGERRWRAARRAGLASIPAIIRETSDDDLLRDALLENLHRSQLNPLEEAAAYQQLLEDFGCTQEELSDRIGRSRPQISNTLRLMKLPPLVQRRLASGALSAGHARALLSMSDPSLMEELAQRIVAEGLSVRTVERLIAQGLPSAAGKRPTQRRSSYNPVVVEMTSRLSNRLETPVRIDVGKRKGKITLEFTNIEDLERLLERIGVDGAGDLVADADQTASAED